MSLLVWSKRHPPWRRTHHSGRRRSEAVPAMFQGGAGSSHHTVRPPGPVRDSKNAEGPVLVFPHQDRALFVDYVSSSC
ncbi:DUF397 domain-containing protein [Streptomyces sp. D2-8]|uniref:DUF397 domain-containing protein n=1 Tax=Streptomyces sp. D2-8 TaxID=2707767 RepID=UPI0035B49C49